MSALGRAWRWLTAPEPLVGRVTASTDLVTLPATAGDVAQLAGLPAEVGQAFGINQDGGPITRAEAMRVPAFARGRNIICGQTGMLEWFVERQGTRSMTRLLEQPDPNTTRQHTFTWTVDDLLCNGIAWWRVLDRDAAGWPVQAERIARQRLTYDRVARRAWIDGQPVDPSNLIRFDGWHEGVLSYGADILRGALAIERLVKAFADNPAPRGWLKDTRDLRADVPEMTDEQIAYAKQRWQAAGVDRFMNRSIGWEESGWSPQELDLTNARNQAAVQIARMLGLPSRQVNAPSESGMTYQTVMGDKTELIDGTLSTYTGPIGQRLSMPDVTPRGWLVLPDRDGYTTGTTKERIEAAAAFVTAGLGPVNEARSRYLGLEPIAGGEVLMPPKPATPSAQEVPR